MTTQPTAESSSFVQLCEDSGAERLCIELCRKGRLYIATDRRFVALLHLVFELNICRRTLYDYMSDIRASKNVNTRQYTKTARSKA